MKKAFILLVALPFLLLACSHFGRKPVSIPWPQQIDYLEAFCEIDVMLKTQQYTGDMSLRVSYPHGLFLEVYGPFGNTILYVDRSEDHFIMRMDNEELTNENDFYRLFRIRIDDIIEDLTLKGSLETEAGIPSKQRPDYRVFYHLNDTENRICWKGHEGDFCMKFFEVSFSREKSIGKGDSGRQ